MLQLAELKSTKDLPMKVKICIPLCKDHDEYYCETHEKLVFMYCMVKDHSSHDDDTVKKVAGRY